MGRTLGTDLGATILNQDIYEISATAKHRLGTRVVRGDRVFKYAKAIQTYTTTKLLARSYYHQYIMYAVLAVASPAGSNKVYVTVGAGDGFANDGVVATNDLEGGYIAIFDASTDEWLNYAIVSNNSAVSGGTVTITLDGELPIALTTADYAEIMSTPYLTTCTNTQNRYSFLGLPMRLATITYPYHWLQTWGPCWVNPQPLLGVSSPSAPKVQAVARHDGSIDLYAYATAAITSSQLIGHVLTVAQDGTQGAPFVELQISP
jgi:hypothetical protein